MNVRIYFDSCIVIYLIEGEVKLRSSVAEKMAEQSQVSLNISDLTRLECRVWPIQNSDDELLLLYDSFFALPEVSTVGINRDVFDLATELRALHSIKTPDAIHLAAALISGCDEFWTNDKRLAKAATDRIKIISQF